MSSINWKYVLFYREIQDYLSQSESFKLALTCKYINKKVKVKTHYLFNLKRFLTVRRHKLHTNPYDPITEDFEHQLGRFQFYLNIHNYPVTKLLISNCSDNYYSYRIPNIFNSIHHLQLVDACVSLELLQYLLTNIRLTSLSLDNCDFFIQNPTLSVILPESLITLHFGECSLRLVNHDGSHISEYVATGSLSPCLFKLDPQNINNLKYFEFSGQSLGKINNLNEFLVYNPQLKTVTGLYRSLNLANLPVLHNLFRMDHLKVEENVFNSNIGEHFIEFEFLKSLSINQSKNTQHAAQLLECCPNIKHFEIRYISTHDYYADLYPILSRMKLKKISIGFQESNSISFSIVAPIISELETLEFSCLLPSKFDFGTLDQLTKLTTIKFINLVNEVLGNKYTRNVGFSLKNFNILRANGNFKCLYYPTSVVYHKISSLL